MWYIIESSHINASNIHSHLKACHEYPHDSYSRYI